MVLLKQADQCFCGALAGMRTRTSKMGKSGSANPPTQLPASTELPAKLAAELQKVTGGDGRQCAVSGVAGPVLAVLLGTADALGVQGKQLSRLQLACRRELNQLLKALGTKAAAVGPQGLAAKAAPANRADAFDVLLAWCATPAVPTYALGVSLALGQEEEPLRQAARDLAWVFRLLCARARVAGHKEAPMLSAACEALCGTEGTGAKLQEAMALGTQLLRRASMPPQCTEKEDSGEELNAEVGRWARFPTDGCIAEAEAMNGNQRPLGRHSTMAV